MQGKIPYKELLLLKLHDITRQAVSNAREERVAKFWNEMNERVAMTGIIPSSLHLAIFSDPYLDLVLQKKKRFESRFSINKIPPYGRVHRGDVILLKHASGPIVATCSVGDVRQFNDLNPCKLSLMKEEFEGPLCIQDPSFWEHHLTSTYATIMEIENLTTIDQILIEKRDRLAWVVIHERVRERRLDDYQ